MAHMTRAQTDARDLRRYTGNILAVYLDAPGGTQEAGRHWYRLERARCAGYAKRRGLTLAAVAGAAAAISPGMHWDYVLAHVEALRVNPRASVPTYSREFTRRAVACLRGGDPREVLSGPKVRAFYFLLAGEDCDAVVVDGHAWNVERGECAVFRNRPGYTVPAAQSITPRRYRLAAAAYREAAEVLGELPHAVQAATWLHWKAIHA